MRFSFPAQPQHVIFPGKKAAEFNRYNHMAEKTDEILTALAAR
jgi:hypothetical protein